MKLIILASLVVTCTGWPWQSTQGSSSSSEEDNSDQIEPQGLDYCSFGMHQLITYAGKRISLPKTDCEIILTERCKNDNQNLRVTMMSTADLMGFKELKIVSGSNVIKAKAERFQIVELIINGVRHAPGGQSQYMEFDDGYIRWHDNKFLWSGSKHGQPGAYVLVAGAYISIQVDSAIISEFGCGLCKPKLSLPQYILSDKAVRHLVIKESVSDRCSIGNPIRQQPSVCSKDDKYIMSWLNGMTCITEEPHPVCNDRCLTKVGHGMTVKARCVRQNLTFMAWHYGDQGVVENDRVLFYVLNGGVLKDLLIYPAQKCG